MQRAYVHTKHFVWPRSLTHLLLGGLSVAVYFVGPLLFQYGKQVEFWIIASGYLCLALVCVTLLIGPFNLLRARRNPVNIYLRRDVGIWAGVAGCWHVCLVLQGSLLNERLLWYFLRPISKGYAPLLTIYGGSNDAGLFATLLLLLLLALSNTYSLRRLKGKLWKRLQRLNYLLLLFAALHTAGYQYLNLRGPLFVVLAIAALSIVLLGQGAGFVLMWSRRRR